MIDQQAARQDPVPPSAGQTSSATATASDADTAAAKQLRQNIALSSDPLVRQRALASLDCSRTDPLVGHDDGNLPLVACDGHGFKYVLDKALLTGEDIADAVATTGQDGTAVVNLTLTDAARSQWAGFTAKNAGNQVAFLVNTTVVTAPTISAPMLDGFIQISGQFNEQGARDIARQITGH